MEARLSQRADPARHRLSGGLLSLPSSAGRRLIETLFVHGLGLLSYESIVRRDSPGRARVAVPLHPDRSGGEARVRLLYVVVDRRVQFGASPNDRARIRPASRRHDAAGAGRRRAARPADVSRISAPGHASGATGIGTWSLWIMIALLVASALAELISNDRPLVARYDGQWTFPVFRNPPETAYGGDFRTPTDWKDPFIAEQFAKPGNWKLDTINCIGDLDRLLPEGGESRAAEPQELARHRFARAGHGRAAVRLSRSASCSRSRSPRSVPRSASSPGRSRATSAAGSTSRCSG